MCYLDKMSSSKSHIRTRSKLNKNEDEENNTTKKSSTISPQITTTNNSNSNITTKKTNRQMIPQQRSSQNQQDVKDDDEEEKDTTTTHTPRHLRDDDDNDVDYDDVNDYDNDYDNDDDKDDDDELDEAEHESTLPSYSTISTNYGLLNWEQVQRLDELLNKPIAIHGRRPGGGGNGWTGGGGGGGGSGGGGGGGNNGTVSYSTSPSPQPQYFAPTLHVKLKDFIRELNRRLIARRVNIKDVRINGGVASYVLAKDHSYQFSDIDIIFGTDLLQMSPPEPAPTSSTGEISQQQQQQPVPTTTYMGGGGNSSSPEACFNMSCDIIRDTVFDFLIEHMPAEIERPTRSLVSPKLLSLSLFYISLL